MTKYIIKNCPNLTTSYYGTGETIHNQCGLTDDDLCANCTHCVLKQIVEKCKQVNTKFYDSVHQRYLSPSKAKFARQILELLEIQECE